MSAGLSQILLHVDLTTGVSERRTPPPEAAGLLGGRGLAATLVRPVLSRSWDDPAQPFCLIAGLLAGAGAPMAGHAVIAAKSPLTGLCMDAAAGGALGAALRRGGYMGLILSGASEEPVGLVVDEQGAALFDADELVGRNTTAVLAELAETLEPCPEGATESVLVTGPAAEKRGPLSTLIVDGRPVGRGGLGASLAAKGVQCLVVRGSGTTPIANPLAFEGACASLRRLMMASPFLTGRCGLASYGDLALFDLTRSRRMAPTANFRRTYFDPAEDRCGADRDNPVEACAEGLGPSLAAPVFHARFRGEPAGCPDCPAQCARRAGGPMEESGSLRLPDAESLSHWTALLENDEAELAVRGYRRCIDLGLDPLSTASALAVRSEVLGRFVCGREALRLLEDLADRRMEGDGLSLGALAYARSVGRPEAAMAVKGLELSAFDPRGAYGMALGMAVATRGGCWRRAFALGHEVLRKPVATERFEFAMKARIIKYSEDAIAALEALGVCVHAQAAAGVEEYASVLAAVTGDAVDGADLLKAGARTLYLERILLREAGCGPEQDDLPGRFYTEAGSGAVMQPVPPLNRSAFMEARAAYYKVRGLDAGGGPLPAVAAQLSLEC